MKVVKESVKSVHLKPDFMRSKKIGVCFPESTAFFFFLPDIGNPGPQCSITELQSSVLDCLSKSLQAHPDSQHRGGRDRRIREFQGLHDYIANLRPD